MRLATLLGTSLLALTAWTSAASATTFSYTGGLQTFTATTAGTYDIVAYGAQGGSSVYGRPGGLGAEIGGDFILSAGEVLTIAVGGKGGDSRNLGATYGGGGGGSFVVANGLALVIAGGGGGSSGDASSQTAGQAGASGADGGNPNGLPIFLGSGGTNGAGGSANTLNFAGGGGGGFLSDGGSNPGNGGSGGASFFNGLAGGSYPYDPDVGGGFGGGGGAGSSGGGGGGGYSGGGGGFQGGGGGGSYNTGLSNSDLILLSGVNTGNGSVTITLLADTVTAVPEPASLALLGAGLVGLGMTLRRRAL